MALRQRNLSFNRKKRVQVCVTPTTNHPVCFVMRRCSEWITVVFGLLHKHFKGLSTASLPYNTRSSQATKKVHRSEVHPIRSTNSWSVCSTVCTVCLLPVIDGKRRCFKKFKTLKSIRKKYWWVKANTPTRELCHYMRHKLKRERCSEESSPPKFSETVDTWVDSFE